MQPDVFEWATSQGGTVVSGLTLTAVEWTGNTQVGNVTYGLIQYTASGSPDLAAVAISNRLDVTDFASNLNNGVHYIVAADNTAKTITVRMTARTDASADETGASGAADIYDIGALKQPPSLQKQAQGFIPSEKPNAQQLNWMLNLLGQWTGFLAAGGANVFRATIEAWRAVTRTLQGLEWVIGLGGVRFDPNAIDTPGEGFIAQDSGSGLGIIESVHPDATAAAMAAFIPEILPPVTINLNFGSTAQNNISTQTVPVPGALPGDAVALGPPSGMEAGFIWAGRVSAANTVEIRLAKITSGTTDPAAGDWSVTVIRPNSMPVITERGRKIYVNLIGMVYDSTSLEADLQISENEAAFNLLVNSRQHRAAILDGGAIEAVVQASSTANAIIIATGGY